MTNPGTAHHDSGEGEHAELVSRLNKLGERDRRGTPANLTDRLVLRTQANLAGHGGSQSTSRVFALGSRGWVRAAAAVLIVGSVIFVFMSIPRTSPGVLGIGPTTGPTREHANADFNLDLVDGSFWGDSLDVQIAVLMGESAMLVGELDREWDDLDYFSDEGAL